MNYQRTLLADMLPIGDPGPLPAELVGLEDVSLADLSWSDEVLGYRGHGFFPVADAPPPPTVPAIISRMQAKMELLNTGLLDTVNAAVEAATGEGSAALKLYWAEASDFHRDHPAIIAMTSGLGMSSDQVDALFIAASQIT